MNLVDENMGSKLASSDSIKTKDFSILRTGTKTLEDAVIDGVSTYKSVSPRLGDKEEVMRAIARGDIETMREISNFFYKTSGIYSRLCKYMAYLYKYDWMVTPYINNHSLKKQSILDGFNKSLMYLDDFQIKTFLTETSLKIIKNGCYYGYILRNASGAAVQELHPKYCRTRFSIGQRPVIEFNMKYFDDAFKDTNFRLRVLNSFPKEFKKGYVMYKEGKLTPDFVGDKAGWFMLEPDNCVKFSFEDNAFPPFIMVIPAIIDLSNAQALDRKKMEQQLLKILIQKMPIDKNGELVFDVDEARELHNNAVRMLGKAIGIDVLTTFADVEVEDMNDNSNDLDEIEKVERAVYNEAGVSQMQFNTDGNLALEKSILNDEASMKVLVNQYELFLNQLLAPFNSNPKKILYRVQILPTTIYNYKELAKTYKEQTQLGYSKMLPPIALGQSQSSVLANAYFENDFLDLINVFIPPLMSSTMSTDMLNKDGETKTVGRTEKPDDEKSEKTIQNKESAN